MFAVCQVQSSMPALPSLLSIIIKDERLVLFIITISAIILTIEINYFNHHNNKDNHDMTKNDEASQCFPVCKVDCQLVAGVRGQPSQMKACLKKKN